MNLDLLYDPFGEEIETGLLAVWLLYKKGAWDKLATYGLHREPNESLLGIVDFRCRLQELSTLDDRGMQLMVRICNEALDAAILITGEYTLVMRPVKQRRQRE
jgi:hypothetical protein